MPQVTEEEQIYIGTTKDQGDIPSSCGGAAGQCCIPHLVICSVVAVVAESAGRKLEISDSKVKIVFANDKPCDMWALVDRVVRSLLFAPPHLKKFLV